MLGGDGMNWQGLAKVLVYIVFPGLIILTVFTNLTEIMFFDFPNIGYWVWITFCFWVGFNSNKWFPAKK